MKKYRVTFKDVFEVENEDEAYDVLLDYLAEIVRYGDVTAFDFKEIKESEGEK